MSRAGIYTFRDSRTDQVKSHVHRSHLTSKFGYEDCKGASRHMNYNKIRQPNIFLKSSCPFPPDFAVSCVSSVPPPRCFEAPMPGFRARPSPALGFEAAAVRGTNNPPAPDGAVDGWVRVELDNASSDISRFIPLKTIGSDRNSSLLASYPCASIDACVQITFLVVKSYRSVGQLNHCFSDVCKKLGTIHCGVFLECLLQ